jgi:hypothetical protein
VKGSIELGSGAVIYEYVACFIEMDSPIQGLIKGIQTCEEHVYRTSLSFLF